MQRPDDYQEIPSYNFLRYPKEENIMKTMYHSIHNFRKQIEKDVIFMASDFTIFVETRMLISDKLQFREKWDQGSVSILARCST